MKLYKILRDNKSCVASSFDWTPYLPHDGQPGEWTPEQPVDMCRSGYHGTDAAHLIDWINGNQLYEVEAAGDLTWHDDKSKFACTSMRLVRQVEAWNDKTLRLFACWCARQAWNLLTDQRIRTAVEVAERFANGEATAAELAAARAAARDAASAAAWDAARAATRNAAWAAAWAATRNAAWAAAWEAAWEAARAAARDAQSKQLIIMLGLEEQNDQ